MAQRASTLYAPPRGCSSTSAPRSFGWPSIWECWNAKVREVEEADYFQMLGLPRSAGREEVQQAFAFLSSQFDPLKFVGHPDPKVLEKAHQLQLTLAEAAAALRDDDLRQLYAQNLVHLG